jgi:hypothetical protein
MASDVPPRAEGGAGARCRIEEAACRLSWLVASLSANRTLLS